MANPFTGGAASFSGIDYLAPEVAQQQREILRQQAIADLLRQKSLEDDNQTQVVSGYAIPNSGVKRFSQLGQALMAGYMQRKIDDKQAAVAQQLANKFNGVSYAPASQSGSATDMLTQPGSATTAPIYDGAVSAPSYDSRKTVAPGATGGALGNGFDFGSAAVLDSMFPGAGKLLLEQQIKANTPIDWERQAKVAFPNDPAKQAQYIQFMANKETSVVQQPGTTVVNMGGTTNVPMSDYQARQLENEQRRIAQGETSNALAARTAGTPGTFAGTGIDAQANNVYIALTLKRNAGEALTPKEQIDYEMAIRQLSQPRLTGTPETGYFMVNPPPLPTGTPPVSATAAPVGAPPPATNDPAGAPPELQPNFPDVRTPGSAPTVTQISAPNKPPNESQSKAAGFASLMENAENVVAETPEGATTYVTKIAGAVPKVGDTLQRAAQTPAQQRYEQAKENWARAKLRNESGALIGEEELAAEIRTYFPQPGDGPEVIKQKANARALAIEAVKKQAGPTYFKPENAGDKKVVKWEEYK